MMALTFSNVLDAVTEPLTVFLPHQDTTMCVSRIIAWMDHNTDTPVTVQQERHVPPELLRQLIADRICARINTGMVYMFGRFKCVAKIHVTKL